MSTTVDINVTKIEYEVGITVTPNLITVNINTVTGGTTPNLPQVLTQGGRLVENWDTVTDGDRTALYTDLGTSTLFYGGASIENTITDDLFPMAKGVMLEGVVNDSIVTFIWNGGANSLVIDATGTFIKYTAHQTEANIWSFGLSSDSLGGGSVTPADLISTDADNALVLGTDNKLFVPESTAPTGNKLEYVAFLTYDGSDPTVPIVSEQINTIGEINVAFNDVDGIITFTSSGLFENSNPIFQNILPPNGDPLETCYLAGFSSSSIVIQFLTNSLGVNPNWFSSMISPFKFKLEKFVTP